MQAASQGWEATGHRVWSARRAEGGAELQGQGKRWAWGGWIGDGEAQCHPRRVPLCLPLPASCARSRAHLGGGGEATGGGLGLGEGGGGGDAVNAMLTLPLPPATVPGRTAMAVLGPMAASFQRRCTFGLSRA